MGGNWQHVINFPLECLFFLHTDNIKETTTANCLLLLVLTSSFLSYRIPCLSSAQIVLINEPVFMGEIADVNIFPATFLCKKGRNN